MSFLRCGRILSIAAVLLTSSFSIRCSEDSDPKGPEGDPRDCSTCTYVVPEDKGTIDGAVLGIKPGDVICLNSAFRYGTLTFKNIVGTAAAPVIITNCDGTVRIEVVDRPFNLKTSNSKYFRLTGGDVDGYYGIQLSGSTANGVVLTDFSTNFEVDHVEVGHVGFAGIMAKTDPTCDNATIRGNFTMKDVSFHHNFIHDTEGEGFYIGHSFFGGYDVSGCGTRLPHTIEGVEINNNYVLRSGWDGIQLSCATKNAAVYGNTVESYGTLNEPAQQNGIILGSGTGGLCFGNFVNGGSGGGITIFGLGDNVVYNNVVLNAGEKGIFCDERGTPTGSGMKFINNTVINPATEGIAIYTETLPNNVCINNIIVNPGTYDKHGENSYILLSKNVQIEKSNNLITREVKEIKLMNAAKDFRLQSSSPAIDQGKDISSYKINVDFYNSQRLKGAAYDIGASEFQ